MTEPMNAPTKPTAAHAFGWDELHPGMCCDCCVGYCVASDYQPAPDEILRFSWAGREWVSDRWISLDAAELVDIPAATFTPSNVKGMATKAMGPATGLIGERTLGILDRLRLLGVADSDVENQHALVIDGQMVGFAMKGREGLPAEYLTRARRMARLMHPVGEPALLLAARAIGAWLDTESAA